MIKKLLLCVLTLSVLFSCKKEEEPLTENTNVFIKFNLDGVSKSATANGSDTYHFFDDFESYVGLTDNGIQVINTDGDDITPDSLVNMKNRKLPFIESAASNYKVRLFFDDASGYYTSNDASSNAFPANYFRMTTVTLIKKETSALQTNNIYLIEGDFTCNLSDDGATDKAATNGTFRLVVNLITF
jgi:hypothetical protein